MLGTFKKVFPYILVGVGIGALIHNWIPESWIETVLGSNNPFGAILATIVGIPMYADIFGTIPVAEALLSKGAQLGHLWEVKGGRAKGKSLEADRINRYLDNIRIQIGKHYPRKTAMP